MRCVVFAYHNVGVQCLQALLDMGAHIPLVLTHSDQRGEEIWFESVEAFARRKGLEVITPENANGADVLARIQALRPDVLFSFYYRSILPRTILNCATHGAFNMHGSLLPKYRGRCPVNWVLINGEKQTGVTLHEMVASPDAGDIVAQKKVCIEEKDTAFTLFGNITRAAVLALKEFYPKLEAGDFQRTPQDHAAATVFGGRRPQDGVFSWDRDARSIYNAVRALTHPYPGAYVPYQGKNLTVWWALPRPHKVSSKEKLEPGTILQIKKNVGVLVATRDGALLLKRVQWDQEQEKAADAFARAHKLSAGMKFA